MNWCKTKYKILLEQFTTCLSVACIIKNIMIVNDTSIIISEWCHNLECHLETSITLLELSIMFLELSIMFLELSIMFLELSIIIQENIHSTGINHEDVTSVVCL